MELALGAVKRSPAIQPAQGVVAVLPAVAAILQEALKKVKQTELTKYTFILINEKEYSQGLYSISH